MTVEPGREALIDASQATLETPFLEVAGTGWKSPATAGEAPFLPETPFVSEYLDGDEVMRPEEPALRQLLEDLYDSEFDEAIADLAAEAETYVGELGLNEAEADGPRAERMLEAWIEPLRRETQAMLLGLAEAFEAEDLSTISEARVDSIFERFEPVNSEYGPVFKGSSSSVWKKAKKLAQGAIKAAKSGIAAVSKLMPIGIILRKLAALARPLLNRVLRFALNKLPVEYREPAKLLARRFLGINIAEALEEEDEDFDEAEWEMEEALEDEEQPATGGHSRDPGVLRRRGGRPGLRAVRAGAGPLPGRGVGVRAAPRCPRLWPSWTRLDIGSSTASRGWTKVRTRRRSSRTSSRDPAGPSAGHQARRPAPRRPLPGRSTSAGSSRRTSARPSRPGCRARSSTPACGS